MASVSSCGADFMKSRLRLGIVTEHAASTKPDAVTAMIRLTIPPPGRLGRLSPQHGHRNMPRNLEASPRSLWLAPTERAQGGSGLSLRSNDLDSISELYIDDDFRQLVLPTSFSSPGDLEDHGEHGLESAFTRPYFKSSELGASHE
jgi:hypothetical protein